MQEVGKVKIELQQVTTKLDGERTAQRDLREKLSEADNKLSGIQNFIYSRKKSEVPPEFYKMSFPYT